MIKITLFFNLSFIFFSFLDLNRDNITDISDSDDSLYTALTVSTIRIGSYVFEPTEKVTFTTKGIRIIAPNVKRVTENCILDIQRREVGKIICCFSKVINVVFIYTLSSCGRHIRDSLDMTSGENSK